MVNISFVSKKDDMNKLKICSKCFQEKDRVKDFYMCLGKTRGECKSCTIQNNVKYQNKVKAWKNNDVYKENRKIYMKEYRDKNKKKYEKYQQQFRERHPDYQKEYSLKRKNSGQLLPPTTTS